MVNINQSPRAILGLECAWLIWFGELYYGRFSLPFALRFNCLDDCMLKLECIIC